jgi:hypothetical protein
VYIGRTLSPLVLQGLKFRCSLTVNNFVRVKDVEMFTSLNLNAGPISCLLVLPRSPMLAHGSRIDQQARSFNRRPPMLPVAPLSKYVASDAVTQEPNPWEGPLVVLPSTYPEDEDLEGHSYSSAAMERQIKELEVSSSIL